ncbi:DNA topoisomerase II [Macleaya cordata]|uniref:DNA topoisomerase (ATP-hydrolyzing) n=1 Tax=Macleaya cordata TaxID=56857 RepID=A0A200QG28_MACCD|nr:DNA topoisomerase II [Macleaya cordata]
MVPIDPWYKGFRGTIEKTATKEAGVSYTITGIVEEINETTLRISELPVRRSTQDYKEFLESIMTGNDKIKDPFIKDYRKHNDDTTVHFEVIMSEENLVMAKQEGLMKKFKLTTTISTSNMHLFDSKGVIKKYDNPEQILEEFFHVRLELYEKRKKVLLDNLELELLKLDNKVRFILGVVRGEIIVSNRKRVDLFLELQQKGFTPFPKKTKNVEALVVGATEDIEENEESQEVVNSRGVRAIDYEYLLSMAIGTLTLEKVQELCSDKDRLTNEVDELRSATPKSLWLKDLDALEKELDEQDKNDVQAEVARKALKSKVMNEAGMKASRQVAKNPRKNNTKKPSNPPVAEATTTSVSTTIEMGNITEAVKPKGRGGPRKAPAKKQEKLTLVDSDEEDDEILELKERLAAYNLDSSPDQSAAMETEVTKVPTRMNGPSRRAAAQKLPSTFTEISDDENSMNNDQIQTIPEEKMTENDHSDEDFELEVVAGPKWGKQGGRKLAANSKAAKPVIETRKRGPTKKQLLSQKLITDVLKLVENAGASPEKKVRKIRASPFNKKSNSMLGRIDDKDKELSPMNSEEKSGSSSPSSSPEESSEVVAERPRPHRANRRVGKYVVSESESDNAANDSDFGEE